MALFLNVEPDIGFEQNVEVQDFGRISECCDVLLQSERARNYVREENDNVIITGMFGNRNIVPDVYRYSIVRCQNKFTLFPHRTRVVNSEHNFYNDIPAVSDQADTLVVVVESPHKDEYHNQDLSSPIAAAQGSTGCGIHCYLAEIVNLISDIGDEYRVIVANPIRWQASLSSLHEQSPRSSPWKELRNAVWCTLWDIAPVRCNFLTRLCNYNPSIVVNACTGGSEDDGLNAKMDQFLLCNNVVPDENRRPRTPHPSVWHQSSNRRIYPCE